MKGNSIALDIHNVRMEESRAEIELKKQQAAHFKAQARLINAQAANIEKLNTKR